MEAPDVLRHDHAIQNDMGATSNDTSVPDPVVEGYYTANAKGRLTVSHGRG